MKDPLVVLSRDTKKIAVIITWIFWIQQLYIIAQIWRRDTCIKISGDVGYWEEKHGSRSRGKLDGLILLWWIFWVLVHPISPSISTPPFSTGSTPSSPGTSPCSNPHAACSMTALRCYFTELLGTKIHMYALSPLTNKFLHCNHSMKSVSMNSLFCKCCRTLRLEPELDTDLDHQNHNWVPKRFWRVNLRS